MQNSKISLIILITQNDEKSETTYLTDASFTQKNDIFLLLFDEENIDDDGVTKCRFEISEDVLRMRRSGSIVVEQIHRIDQITDGYIKTPYGRMNTEIKTTNFSFIERSESEFQLHLAYDLYMKAEKSGAYKLDINIKLNEEAASSDSTD